MRATFVQTRNVARLWEVVESLHSASLGEPRLGLIYGPAGRGKTRAVDTLAARTGAVYVSAARVWTPKLHAQNHPRHLGVPGHQHWSR